ncbi:MAG: aspartate--tRNA(Asn) ligase [Patescibacteria group bacterium]|nr:aspartate--tRNA(Asn) ligase [Patescibacteria group bacterium]
MDRTKIIDVKKQTGEKVKILGWINTVRDLGSIRFFLVRDISGIIQTVILKKNDAVFKLATDLSQESVVEIAGKAKKEKQAPGGVEIEVEDIKVLSQADPELPIPVAEKTKKETAQTKRMDWRWLDIRKPKRQLIFKVWTEMERAMREYFLQNDFLQIHSPKLMSAPSESGAELFELPYFNRKAYLAQSPQFYKQMAMAAGLEKVFEVGPVFRAEPSFTSRHGTEFTGYDAEISFIESYEDIMKMVEKMFAHIIKAVKEKHGEAIKKYYEREVVIPQDSFPRITMQEAKKVLKELGVKSEKSGDLNQEEEKALSAHILKKAKSEFVFVTEYPIDIRPFYHMRIEDRPKVTKSFDILWNGIEIATGSQREHRYKVLKKQAMENGMSEESIKHYLNFFKYGCPPHGGIGMGPARMVMKFLNLASIREASFVYRGINRLTP